MSGNVKLDYYAETIAASADAMGVVLSAAQIEVMAKAVADSADLWPEASGELAQTVGRRESTRRPADVARIAALEHDVAVLRSALGRERRERGVA